MLVVTTLSLQTSFNILQRLDARTLIALGQLSPLWRARSEDDRVWRVVCQRHGIDEGENDRCSCLLHDRAQIRCAPCTGSGRTLRAYTPRAR